MKREDDQELWDFLGKSSAPTLSPFFARNVVRQVRQERRPSAFSWLRPRVLVPSAAVALAVVAGLLSVNRPATDSIGASDTTVASSTAVTNDAVAADEVPITVAQLDPRDFEVVADLDNLLAFEEEESLWEDT